ncbi:type II toxin-antitoxin system PrlF family antitoxin [Vreelandella subglaciescola]|nr:type II toxin-antitoxin system PrlF family antitoxin [Halomonas subglaciescola]
MNTATESQATMQAATIEDSSALTDRNQTTVPASIRKALHLGRRDRIRYEVRSNGEVVMSRAERSPDPAMASFLAFLEQDMQAHPQNIRPVTASSLAEAQRLTAGMEPDLDEALPEDDDE